jgi:hypothetical protein
MIRTTDFEVDHKTLAELKAEYKRIVSDWNGKDNKFTSGGVSLTEDDAHMAEDILDQIDNLEKMIISFQF